MEPGPLPGLFQGSRIQRTPLLSGVTKGTRVGPGTAQGSSHLFQQACSESIVQNGKWGSERLSNSPEITQPGHRRAQTGTQICLIPELVISNCPAPLPTSRSLLVLPPPPPATRDAPWWWCFPGRRALTLDGKGLAPQPSLPGPQKPTVPVLHPRERYPRPHTPWGSLCDGGVPFSLALMKGGLNFMKEDKPGI